MGITNVSFEEEIAKPELMSQSAFPKIKKLQPNKKTFEKMSSENHFLPIIKNQNFIWVVIFVSILQSLILFATVFLFFKIKSMVELQKETEMNSTQPSESIATGVNIINRVSNDTGIMQKNEVYLGKMLLVSDFNGSEYTTKYGTPFFIANDPISREALTIKLDSKDRYGKYGNSLKIHYKLSKESQKFPTIIFEIPNIDISHYEKLAFRLRSQAAQDNNQQINVQLIDIDNKVINNDVLLAQSFWKKYELLLPSVQKGSSVNQVLLKEIKFMFPGSNRRAEGDFYLDDISFE